MATAGVASSSATDVTAMENAKAVDKEITPDVDLIDAYGTHFDVVCPDIFAAHRVLNQMSPEAVWPQDKSSFWAN